MLRGSSATTQVTSQNALNHYRLQRFFQSLIKLSKYVCQVQWTGFSLIAWFFVSRKCKNVFFASVIFRIFYLNVI